MGFFDIFKGRKKEVPATPQQEDMSEKIQAINVVNIMVEAIKQKIPSVAAVEIGHKGGISWEIRRPSLFEASGGKFVLCVGNDGDLSKVPIDTVYSLISVLKSFAEQIKNEESIEDYIDHIEKEADEACCFMETNFVPGHYTFKLSPEKWECFIYALPNNNQVLLDFIMMDGEFGIMEQFHDAGDVVVKPGFERLCRSSVLRNMPFCVFR